MKDAFIDHFTVDETVILAELKALAVQDYDVDKYTEQFNSIASQYSMSNFTVDEQWLKQLYTDALPYKVKEHLQLDREYTKMSLSFLQNEARRLHKTLNSLRRGGPKPQREDYNSQPKEEKKGVSSKDSAFQGNQGNNNRTTRLNIAQLHHKMHCLCA